MRIRMMIQNLRKARMRLMVRIWIVIQNLMRMRMRIKIKRMGNVIVTSYHEIPRSSWN
jgi:hypothetical protein